MAPKTVSGAVRNRSILPSPMVLISLTIWAAMSSLFGGPVFGESPWKMEVPFFVGANFSDFQNYAQVAYFHGGMDICAPAGTTLFSPVSGTVKISRYRIDAGRTPPHFEYVRFPWQTPENQVWKTPGEAGRYIEVAIKTSDGTSWMFRHVDVVGFLDRLLKLDGTDEILKAGEPIGKVVAWSDIVYPETRRYDHCHLEIVNAQGEYVNPGLRVPPFSDHIAPVISGIWFVPNEEEHVIYGKDQIPVLRNDVDIIAQIDDLMDGSKYPLSPFRIRYALICLSDSGARVVQPMTDAVLFTSLPVTGDRTQGVGTLYKERIILRGKKILESQGNSLARKFLFILTNGTPAEGYTPNRAFLTRRLPDGLYRVDVEASDLAGNVTVKGQEFEVRNH